MIYPIVQHDISANFQADLLIKTLHGNKRPSDGANAKRADCLPLIIREPQWVKFADRFFFLRAEGLYRFWDWGKARWNSPDSFPKVLDNRTRYSSVIVYRNDILELLRALSSIHVHGIYHRGLCFEDKIAAAKRGLLSLTCSCISDFACVILNSLGWQTRRVGAMRIADAYNLYDNGHQLFEFYWPRRRKWILSDIDMCQMFVKNDEYLNLGEISTLIQKGIDFDLEPLTISGTFRFDTSKTVTGEYCGFEMFQQLLTKPDMLKWFQRTLAVPVIYSEQKGFFFCDCAADRRRVGRYSPNYIALDSSQWLERFYGNKSK